MTSPPLPPEPVTGPPPVDPCEARHNALTIRYLLMLAGVIGTVVGASYVLGIGKADAADLAEHKRDNEQEKRQTREALYDLALDVRALSKQYDTGDRPERLKRDPAPPPPLDGGSP